MPAHVSSHARSLHVIVVCPHELSPEQSMRHGQPLGHTMPLLQTLEPAQSM